MNIPKGEKEIKNINVNGENFVQVDTADGYPILLKKEYVKTYEMIGLDAGSPLEVDPDDTIVADGYVVGYFGYKG
jgi:hypothetical protein